MLRVTYSPIGDQVVSINADSVIASPNSSNLIGICFKGQCFDLFPQQIHEIKAVRAKRKRRTQAA